MNYSQRQLIQLYLSNLQVNVTAADFNQVWTDWQDFNYTPDYNKFYLISDGEGWLKIGDSEYYPKPGQWFLMPQGVEQSYSFTDGPRYTKFWCHFTAKIGQTNLFDQIKTPFFIETGNDDKPSLLFQELLSSQSSKKLTSPLSMKAAMLNLISYYIEHATLDPACLQNEAMSEPLLKVIHYIDTNYRRTITISELAEQVHLHPNYLIRIFKRHLGTSPIQYINRKKIEEVKWLLVSTNLQISEIGNMVGISEISYLYKLFKAYTGFSPSAYRKINSSG